MAKTQSLLSKLTSFAEHLDEILDERATQEMLKKVTLNTAEIDHEGGPKKKDTGKVKSVP